MIFLAIPLTVAAYWLATQLYRRFPNPLFNPVLVSMSALIVLFVLAPLDLDAYQRGSVPMTWLLNPAVVALAVPLYRHLPKMRAHLGAMLGALTAGVLASTIVGTALTVLGGGTTSLAASLAPKAVTTPVAMAIAEATGGVPSIAAASVIFAGITGASFGFAILKRLGYEDDPAVGLAIGAASHALGTARSAEVSEERGAYATVALVVSAVLTSIVVPLLLPWLLRVLG